MKKHVFLIGLMGSGKSSLGKKLAPKLGLPFLDLDTLIEEQQGRSIAGIFRQEGEEAFRKIERNTLHSLESLPAHIVALGGGTPCFFDNMDFCNRTGRTVYLKVNTGILASRLKPGADDRTLLTGKSTEQIKEFLEEQLKVREVYYQKADVVIEDPGSLSIAEIVGRVV